MVKFDTVKYGWSKPAGRAAVAATYAAICVLWSPPALADEICDLAQQQYVEALAAGMQKFASKLTQTGSFSVKDEYPGNGLSVAVITFVDRGNVVFVHRVTGSKSASATIVRPGKTKSGEHGLSVALTQGSLGNCMYSVFPKDGRFVAAFRGLKR